MVAFADDYRTAAVRDHYSHVERFCYRSVHLHYILEMPKEKKGAKSLETLAVLSAASLVAALLFKNNLFIYASLCLLVIGLFFKTLSNKISDAWLKFAEIVGGFNSRLILSLVFFLVLTPIALLYRFFKGDFMGLTKRRENSETCWVARNHKFEARDLENPW